MPGKLIDRLQAGLATFARTGETPAGLLSPDFELRQASSIIDTAGVFHGPGALRESLDELGGSFEDLAFELEGFREAPGGEIVVLVHARARGRASGLETDNRIAWVWSFRDEVAVRMVVYENPDDALEAVGLER
jgi:ketosteroid isomerase-like protein